ncbi:MAG: helix-turn-helix transcriptional regulator [Lachnospiraceae bacterium]|nr:helix-turn-helix transcriptional regulator [Lachnospiraceae bacterium]
MNSEFRKQYIDLGLNIAYYRKKNGLSQMELADKINVSRTHMSRIETAQCAVSLDVVFDICGALKIRPASLFDFRD